MPNDTVDHYPINRTPCIYMYYNLFRSMTSYFGVTVNFEASALNYHKRTMHTTVSKITHICVTTVPNFPTFYPILICKKSASPWPTLCVRSCLTLSDLV